MDDHVEFEAAADVESLLGTGTDDVLHDEVHNSVLGRRIRVRCLIGPGKRSLCDQEMRLVVGRP